MNSNDYRAHMVANAKRRANASYTGAMRSTSRDIKHWKYIKREKVNGKWRYYYDTEQLKNDIKDKLGYDEKERMQEAERDMNRNIEARDAALKDYNTNRTEAKSITDNYQKKAEDSASLSKAVEYAKTASTEVEPTKNKASASVAYYHQMSEAAKSSGQKYISAKADYAKTTLARAEKVKETVQSGLNWLKNNIFNVEEKARDEKKKK